MIDARYEKVRVEGKVISQAVLVVVGFTSGGRREVLHWAAFNIPASTMSLAEGVPNQATLTDGTIQPLNTGKKNGYMGMGARAPGPYHHYTYELFALDTKLSLGPDATQADVLKAMDGHILAKAVLEGRFHRP